VQQKSWMSCSIQLAIESPRPSIYFVELLTVKKELTFNECLYRGSMSNLRVQLLMCSIILDSSVSEEINISFRNYTYILVLFHTKYQDKILMGYRWKMCDFQPTSGCFHWQIQGTSPVHPSSQCSHTCNVMKNKCTTV